MSAAPSSVDRRPTAPGGGRAAYRMLLRMLLTRGRLAGLAALGVLAVLVGLAGRLANDSDLESVVDLIEVAGFGLFAPVIALVLAAAVLGDLVEDQTLVYLWMRPTPRWRLALAAHAACCTVALPFVAVPMVLMAVAVGQGSDVVAGAGAAAVLAVAAYAGVFVPLGLRLQRALLWGLAYVLVWEGVVASVGSTLARTSLRLHLADVLRDLAGAQPDEFGVATGVSVAVLVVVAVGGVGLTTWLLRRADVA